MTHAPKYVNKALTSASGVNKCWINCKKSQNWLFDNLGLNTDDNHHTLGSVDVDFCWKAEKWFVA